MEELKGHSLFIILPFVKVKKEDLEIKAHMRQRKLATLKASTLESEKKLLDLMKIKYIVATGEIEHETGPNTLSHFIYVNDEDLDKANFPSVEKPLEGGH